MPLPDVTAHCNRIEKAGMVGYQDTAAFPRHVFAAMRLVPVVNPQVEQKKYTG